MRKFTQTCIMNADLSTLHAAVYNCLVKNKHRTVPFDELCAYICTSCEKTRVECENSPQTQCQARIMEALLLLCDLDLVCLNELTDQSSIRRPGRN